MRVISGSARGRRLLAPDGMSVRPTLDRVKESVFNMLAPFVRDSVVLDLFAGSGALGIEALSRGACEAVFVDKSAESLRIVRENLSLTHLADRAVCVHDDFLSYLANVQARFDLVFLDPPYAAGYIVQALAKLKDSRLLTPDALVICELSSADEFKCPDGFSPYRDKKYGKARILLMKEL